MVLSRPLQRVKVAPPSQAPSRHLPLRLSGGGGGAEEKQDFILIQVGKHDVGTALRIGAQGVQFLGHPLDGLAVRARQDPHLPDGSDVDVEQVGQAAHFDGLVLQDCSDQLSDRDDAVLLSPDVQAEPDDVHALLLEGLGQGLPLLDEKELHERSPVRQDGGVKDVAVGQEGAGSAPLLFGVPAQVEQMLFQRAFQVSGPGGQVEYLQEPIGEDGGSRQQVAEHF